MPAFVLKKMIMNNFTAQEVDEDIADSIDFMVERVSGKQIKQGKAVHQPLTKERDNRSTP